MNRSVPFVFGKLPSHGDFIARGLSGSSKAAWDAWASEGLALARNELGAGYEAAHDTAPPWRFVLGPGRFGEGWRAGALAPSIDSAGRRFVVVAAGDGLDAGAADAAGGLLAEQMEGLIYEAFTNGWDADAFVENVGAALSASDGEGLGPTPEGWWTVGGNNHPPVRLACEPAEQVLLRMLAPGASEAMS